MWIDVWAREFTAWQSRLRENGAEDNHLDARRATVTTPALHAPPLLNQEGSS
jgi:hypothetical protein